MRARLALAGVASALAGCATTPPAPPPAVPHATIEPAPAWLQIATADTARAIDALPRRFAAARSALPRRIATRATGEGALLDPAAAETAPELPPGPYHCRLVRIGGRAGLRSFPPDLCHVAAAADGTAFTKAAGENLIGGYLYPDGARRLILLATARRAGDAERRYGSDPASDVGGIVERVSAFRWRLVLTRAALGAAIDLYELVPVTPQVPGARPLVPGD